MTEPKRRIRYLLNRRIGGLEIKNLRDNSIIVLNRRIGGLENHHRLRISSRQLNRRIGGLEIKTVFVFVIITLNRRIGGLEKWKYQQVAT